MFGVKKCNTFCILKLALLELEFSKQYRYAEAIPMSYLRMHLKYREKKSLDNANNYFKQLCVLCIMSSNFMSGILGVDKC